MCAAERVTDRCAGTVVRGACVRVCVRESTHFCTSESTRPSCGCSCSTASGPSLPAPSDTAATASGSWWRGRPGGGHAPLGTRRRSPARYTRLDTHARAPAGASVGRSFRPVDTEHGFAPARRHGRRRKVEAAASAAAAVVAIAGAFGVARRCVGGMSAVPCLNLNRPMLRRYCRRCRCRCRCCCCWWWRASVRPSRARWRQRPAGPLDDNRPRLASLRCPAGRPAPSGRAAAAQLAAKLRRKRLPSRPPPHHAAVTTASKYSARTQQNSISFLRSSTLLRTSAVPRSQPDGRAETAE